jgi:hypothetical protein
MEQIVVMNWPLAAPGDRARVRQDVQGPGTSGLGDPDALRGRAIELSSAAMACKMRKRVGSAGALVILIMC